MGRGAWQATVQGFTKSWTWLSNFHTHIHILPIWQNHTCQNFLHFSKQHNGKVCLKRNTWVLIKAYVGAHVFAIKKILKQPCWKSKCPATVESGEDHTYSTTMKRLEGTHVQIPSLSQCFLPILWKYNLYLTQQSKRGKKKMQNPSWLFFLSNFLGAYSVSEAHMVNS